MCSAHTVFLVTVIYPFIGAVIAVAVPHLIHATQLLADPWAQESWQFEATCAAVVVEHWFIPEAPAHVQPSVKPTRSQVKPALAQPARSARPLPAFLVRRHQVTREELVFFMDLMMSAAHAEVVAAHARELQAESEVSQLRTAMVYASACAKSGYSSRQTKQLEKMAAAFKHIPERWREEIKETRKCWRNPQGVHARLEDILTYM